MDQLELKEQLTNLKEGKIIIKDTGAIADRLNFFDLKLKSYENLFNTCITNNSQISNEFNMNRFLDEYSQLYIIREMFIKESLINIIGQENFDIMIENDIEYMFNIPLKIYHIYKKSC